MPKVYNVNETMNNIRVKLYSNYLEKAEGKYIARNESDMPLSIEKICAHMKNRAGFTGSYKDAVDHVRQFMKEAMYQLCSGKAVEMDYFSIYSNVGGTFNSERETHSHQKNPVTFRFRCRKAMRELARTTDVIITGLADNSGFIEEFTDVSNDVVNETLMPGEQFVITGNKIKVEGDDPACGIYFESVPDNEDDAQSVRRVKVEGRLAENSSQKIIGIVPMLEVPSKYKVVIISQYAKSRILLKAPRTITSSFVLKAA
jgi:hypothetical protein